MANHIDVKKRKLDIQPTTPDVMEYWPAWRYDPQTGKGRIFNDEEEVPSGWVETWAETKPGKAEGAEVSTFSEVEDADEEPNELEPIDDLTVKIIKARLDRRDVPYAKSADKAQLYQLLEENWAED